MRVLTELVRAQGTSCMGPDARVHLNRETTPLAHGSIIGAALRAVLAGCAPELLTWIDALDEAALPAQVDALLVRARAIAGTSEESFEALLVRALTPDPQPGDEPNAADVSPPPSH